MPDRFVELFGSPAARVPVMEPSYDGRSDQVSFPARIDRERAGNEFPEPTPASKLKGGDGPEWIHHGYLCRGGVTLLLGLWKSGKTTYVGWLLSEMASGGDLGGKVEAVRVLYVSEETEGMWAQRREAFGFGDNVEFLCRVFLGVPTMHEWTQLVQYVARLVQEREFDVVVFDTLANHWCCPNENDAAEVGRAVKPLHAIAEAGCALLLVHHPRKGDGNQAQASRGSGALPAFVDVIVEMRRFNPSDREDTRRCLTAYSRYEDTPSDQVLRLVDDGYHLVGSKHDAAHADRLAAVREILTTDEPGQTIDEILEGWTNEDTKPGARRLRSTLKAACDTGTVAASGSGRKGDPYRFRIPFRHTGTV